MEQLANRTFGLLFSSSYIRTSKDSLYLTVSIDLFDTKVVALAISRGLNAEDTAIDTWRMAIKKRPILQI